MVQNLKQYKTKSKFAWFPTMTIEGHWYWLTYLDLVQESIESYDEQGNLIGEYDFKYYFSKALNTTAGSKDFLQELKFYRKQIEKEGQ